MPVVYARGIYLSGELWSLWLVPGMRPEIWPGRMVVITLSGRRKLFQQHSNLIDMLTSHQHMTTLTRKPP